MEVFAFLAANRRALGRPRLAPLDALSKRDDVLLSAALIFAETVGMANCTSTYIMTAVAVARLYGAQSHHHAAYDR